VAAVRLDTPLPAGPGVDVEDGDADPAQVADQPIFLEPPGLEQAQHTAVMGRAGHPPKLVPERPVALPADHRRAEVLAEPVAGIRLVGGEDRLHCRACARRQRRHQAPAR